MNDQKSFPYPTPFEIVRYILVALDLKFSDKALDDAARERVYDSRKLEKIIIKKVSVLIRDTMGPQAKTLVTAWIRSLLNDYMKLVVKMPADGLSRDEMIKILIKGFFKQRVNQLIEDICNQVSGPKSSLLVNAEETVRALLNWMEENEGGWKNYRRNIIKENKEKFDFIDAWKRGQNLPSMNKIENLQKESKGPWPEQIDWQRVRILLFTARALDVVKSDISTLLQLPYNIDRDNYDMCDEMINLQDKFFNCTPILKERLMPLEYSLKTRNPKKNPDRFRDEFFILRNEINNVDKLTHISYRLNWMEARFYVFSGDLIKANELYKIAFNDGLFRSGFQQEILINEALVVAASQIKPEKVFLKHLKWSLINFGYDIRSTAYNKPSTKAEHTIENWEIEMWHSQLTKLFPKGGLFPGVEFDLKHIEAANVGPHIIDEILKIRPNYRSPNKRISVGEIGKERIPQLVYFAKIGDYEICKKLVDRGAKLNVSSEDSETLLLISLLKLDVTHAFNTPPLDDRFFNLFSAHQGCKDVVNQRSQKARLLPIIQAVKSGSIDILTKVLQLGADVNGRGETDLQTALYLCLNLISNLKEPEKIGSTIDLQSLSPEELDSIRRNNPGYAGFSLAHQKQFMVDFQKDSLSMEIFNRLWSMSKIAEQKLNIENMRDIACLLIKSGADANAEHNNPLKGYTPLMLAAEIDEKMLFERMLANGGDSEKYYIDPRDGQKISCVEIVLKSNSHGVFQCLKSIKPYTEIN
jgi:ankyrin repeat protein